MGSSKITRDKWASLACLAASPAFAQTSFIAIYGIMDASVETNDTRTAGWAANTRQATGSSLPATGLPNLVTAAAGAINKSRTAWVGLGLQVGTGYINVQAICTKTDVVGRRWGEATTVGVAYLCSLLRCTTLYAGVGNVFNNNRSPTP